MQHPRRWFPVLVAGQAAGLLLAPLLWGVAPLLAAPAVPAMAPASGAAAGGPAGSAAAGNALPAQRRSLNELQERGQRFQPLRSGAGMVVSQEALASQVGAAILSRGGNAVDAAVATAFALAVTLPQAGNLGGGGFLVLWLPGASPAAGRGCLARSEPVSSRSSPESSESPERPVGQGFAVAVNFRETAPAAATAAMFQRADGSVDRPLATRSLRSTAVPGSVAGMLLAQRCYGRLPRSLVLAPAIALAEKGVRVDQELADSLTAALPLLGADRTSRELFLRPLGMHPRRSPAGGSPAADAARSSGAGEAARSTARQPADPPPSPTEPSGSTSSAVSAPTAAQRLAPNAAPTSPPGAALALRAPQLGDLLRQPQLAATLRRIALQGEAGFYRGPVADALVRLMAERGGLISAADLRAYRAELVRPVQASFRGYPLLSMPPPGGGLSLLQLLQLLEPFDLEVSGAGSALTAHRLAEAMNLVFRDRNQWLGDPRGLATPIPDLLDPAYLDRLRRSLDPGRHRPAASLAAPPPPRRESVNTTHLSVADREGGLVALTTTLNFAYGNGISVPGAGFLLNNEMDDFSAAPGRPNAFGLVQGEANAIAPGRRPLSSMAPTLVFRPDGTPWIATGSPGGSRILSTVAQVLLQRIVWGANLATAVAAPRLHSQLWPDQLALEEGFSPDTRRLLEAMGHAISSSPAMGAANSVEVLRHPGTGSLGAADPRRGIGGAVAEPR